MARKHTLYIHIGSHKTGTTSIQHALAGNADGLRANGLHFFYRDFHCGQNWLPDLHSWLGFIEERRVVPRGMRLLDLPRLTSELAAIDSNVVVSSENFSFFFEEEEIASLAQGLSACFAPIKIVCYIRRQDQHVISHHREGSRLKWYAEHDLWGHSTFAIPPHGPGHDLYLNYSDRLGKWGDAFGDENIVIRVYDRKGLLHGDSVADFFQVLGVNTLHPIQDKNKSLDYLTVKLGHLINSSAITHKKHLAQLLEHAPRLNRPLMPSKDEALSFYSRYVDSNKALNERFRISQIEAVFNDDFSMYPDVGTDSWDEEAANEAIAFLLKLLDDAYGAVDVDTLRNAGVALELKDLPLSFKLMIMAQKFRPNGPFINRKLVEYAANPALREALNTP